MDWKPITKLRSITCHMGSHSVTQHRWTHPALPQPCRPVLDLPTPEGSKAELTSMLVIYRDGLPVRRQSAIQVVPLDSDPTGSQTHKLVIASPTSYPLHYQATSDDIVNYIPVRVIKVPKRTFLFFTALNYCTCRAMGLLLCPNNKDIWFHHLTLAKIQVFWQFLAPWSQPKQHWIGLTEKYVLYLVPTSLKKNM